MGTGWKSCRHRLCIYLYAPAHRECTRVCAVHLRMCSCECAKGRLKQSWTWVCMCTPARVVGVCMCTHMHLCVGELRPYSCVHDACIYNFWSKQTYFHTETPVVASDVLPTQKVAKEQLQGPWSLPGRDHRNPVFPSHHKTLSYQHVCAYHTHAYIHTNTHMHIHSTAHSAHA